MQFRLDIRGSAPGDEAVGAHENGTGGRDAVAVGELPVRVGGSICRVEVEPDTEVTRSRLAGFPPRLRIRAGEQHEVALEQVEGRDLLPVLDEFIVRRAGSRQSVQFPWIALDRTVIVRFGDYRRRPVAVAEVDVVVVDQRLQLPSAPAPARAPRTYRV